MSHNLIVFCAFMALNVQACGVPAANAGTSTATAQPAFKTHIRIVTDTATFSLRVELATTEAQRALGLMYRTQLPPNAGMLFLYPKPQPPTSSFWMLHTRIPLDIAFLGADGRILNIQTMAPCQSTIPWRCPIYPAGVTYSAALEVNKGYFAHHAISVGDRVRLPTDISDYMLGK